MQIPVLNRLRYWYYTDTGITISLIIGSIGYYSFFYFASRGKIAQSSSIF